MNDYHPAGSCDACSEPPDLTAAKLAGLRDEADQQRIRAEAAEADLDRLTATLARVRNLHHECEPSECGDVGWCHACQTGWPCPTVRALNGEVPDA